MGRRSHWPGCLTNLEFSNHYYADNAAEVFCLQAFGMPHLGMHVCQAKPVKSNDRQDCRLTPWR